MEVLTNINKTQAVLMSNNWTFLFLKYRYARVDGASSIMSFLARSPRNYSKSELQNGGKSVTDVCFRQQGGSQ